MAIFLFTFIVRVAFCPRIVGTPFVMVKKAMRESGHMILAINCPSPICSCGVEDETTSHFLLCCPRYNTPRQAYLSKISEITNSDVSILPKDHLTDLLLYGSKAYNTITNELILTETILFIYRSKRFKHLEAFS